MKPSITFLKQVCIVFLFAGLTACGGAEKDSLKAEIEQTIEELGNEITAAKTVKMEQQAVIDGLKEDLKWDYSEGLDKLVSQYESEFSMVKENIDELNSLYDAVVGYQEKLGGAPFEYSLNLVKEMFEENRKEFAEIVEENEAVEEKFYDLAEQVDQLGVVEDPQTTETADENEGTEAADVQEEGSRMETTDSVE